MMMIAQLVELSSRDQKVLGWTPEELTGFDHWSPGLVSRSEVKTHVSKEEWEQLWALP